MSGDPDPDRIAAGRERRLGSEADQGLKHDLRPKQVLRLRRIGPRHHAPAVTIALAQATALSSRSTMTAEG